MRLQSMPHLNPPFVSLHTAATGAAPGLIITERHSTGQQGPLIVDGGGDIVWFLPISSAPSAHQASNVSVQQYRGKPVLCWWEGNVVNGHGVGHYVIYDTSYRKVAEVHAGNGYSGDLHEFFLTDQGTAVFTCYGLARHDFTEMGGASSGLYYYGVVQEVDVASGRVVFQWRSDDHVTFWRSLIEAPRFGRTIWDYFHINSVCIDPSDGNFVVSGRNTSACYKVHRNTGEVLWQLGGSKSDFTIADDARFNFQHHVVLRGDGIMTMFDNENGPRFTHSPSSGLVLKVSEASRQVSLVRRVVHQPPIRLSADGSVQLVGNDHAFICWGLDPFFTEYDSHGRILMQMSLGNGSQSYRAFKQEWHGLPAGAPAVGWHRRNGNTYLYVSWNGATEITHWKVRSGGDSRNLQIAGTAKRRGFETGIIVGNTDRYFQVTALGANSKHLGRSAVVDTGSST